MSRLWVLLALSGWRPRMLFQSPKCPGRSPTERDGGHSVSRTRSDKACPKWSRHEQVQQPPTSVVPCMRPPLDGGTAFNLSWVAAAVSEDHPKLSRLPRWGPQLKETHPSIRETFASASSAGATQCAGLQGWEGSPHWTEVGALGMLGSLGLPWQSRD